MAAKERREVGEKHGVVFAVVKNGIIQLEERLKLGSKYFGFTIIPGGGVEPGETLEETMLREFKEEYDATAVKYKELGSVLATEEDLTINVRHVYLVSDWVGTLSNPENRNGHIEKTLEEARILCTHPISQRILDMVEDELSRQN